MKTTRFKVLLGLTFLLLLCSSCGSSKKFVYLQDMHMGERYPFDTRFEAVIHRDDRLSIIVSCKQPELAIPFNAQNGFLKVSAGGDLAVGSDASGEIREKGYRVDVNGNINFPILGELLVEGKTLGQVRELIQNLIIEGNYIKEPMVSVEFLNFHYTVLGATGRNGTFNSESDRITLLDALANAGGLAVNACVDRVSVIREIGDERQIFVHDLRSRELFNSPCYYLQQNDIVYVEPKYLKKDKGDKVWQYVTGLFSACTAVTSIIWATK